MDSTKPRAGSRPQPARRGRRFRLTAGAAAAVVGLVIAGCSSSHGHSSTSSSSSKVVTGGSLSFALNKDPICLDPQQITFNTSLIIGRNLADSLTDQNPKTGQIVPWLATSWKITNNYQTFTFDIRHGVTFSDGEALNAQAVKTSYEGAAALGKEATGISIGETYLSGLKSVNVLDPYTVQINFSSPQAQFLQATSTETLSILAPKTYSYTPAQRCAGHIIGSGPFTLTSYTPNQSVVIQKRAGYNWPSSLYQNHGAAYLDKITFPIISDASVLTGSLQSHQADAIYGIANQDVASLQKAGGQFDVLSYTGPGVTQSLFPNVTRPALSDVRVRQAIQKLINRTVIRNTQDNNLFHVASSILESDTPGYVNLSSDVAYDLSGAEKLLEAAGWKTGAGGYRYKNGQELKLTLPYAGTVPSALELVQEELKAGGIDLDIQTVSTAQQYQDLANGSFDLAYANLTRDDPDALADFLLSGQFENLTHRSTDAIDTLLNQQNTTTNTAARDSILTQIQKDVLEQGYAFPVTESVVIVATANDVHGLVFTAQSRMSFYSAWKG